MNDENKPISFSEFHFGKEYSQRMENFRKDMEKMDKKYSHELKKGDTLSHHVFIKHPSIGDNGTHFSIRNPEGISEEAKAEMMEVFAKNYNPDYKNEG